MSDEKPQQTEWEDEVDLSEETTYVAIYPQSQARRAVDGGGRRAGLRESVEVPL